MLGGHMANPDHLAILREASDKGDIEIWNNWRKDNLAVKLDLSGADLNDVHLSGADLSAANLSKANLHNADLSGADLNGAYLSEIKLSMAKLNEAKLSRAKLFGADLRRADLSGANLMWADLNGAKLIRADLSRAELFGAKLIAVRLNEAKLIRADLSGAKLIGADLRKADLIETDLIGANLRKADLIEADLIEAKLNRADFTEAKCGRTIFSNVDLSEVNGLETVKHWGPSTIGIDTLYLSRGNIPHEFLEGCGVPQNMIDYAKSLTGQAIDFHSCFISYNNQDEEFCKRLAELMKTQGLRVWFAPDDIKGGKKIHEQIYDAIHYHDKLIVVLSEHSMNSNWVETEIRRARKRERDENRRVLFPIRLTDYGDLQEWELFDADEGRDLAQEIREYFIPDFSNWKDHDSFTIAFNRLVDDLQKDE